MFRLKVWQTGENDYFELDKWYSHNMHKKTDMFSTVSAIIIKELESMNWKCLTSFGGTGLFIYSTEHPPITYHADGFL